MVLATLLFAFPVNASGQESASETNNSLSKIDADASEFFESKVRPLLIEKCLDCHSHETEVNGGLSLDSKSDWSKGGDSGPAILPTDLESSLFLEAIAYRNPKLRMPPEGKLSDVEQQILRRWVLSGAYDPRLPLSASKKKQMGLPLDQAASHWAYRPIERDVALPEHEASSSVDALLAETHRVHDLPTSGIASPNVLLRRLHIDLSGLRPLADLPLEDERRWTSLRSSGTPLASDRGEGEEAYRQQIDELLASPRFGEHFARHWMDVVRFSESLTLRGLVFEDAWRYRQYLIDSFNADKPFDRFVREQIAGDLMDSENLIQKQQQWIATTMLALGDTNMEEQDKKQLEMDFIDEQIEVIGRAFLGQTLGCARCHDHKFDPIPTSDYYALAGILKSSKGIEHDNVSKWVRRPLPLTPEEEAEFDRAEKDLSRWKKQLESLKSKLSTPSQKRSVVNPEQLPGLVIDDREAKKTGRWSDSEFVKPFVGKGYVHDENAKNEVKSIVFEPGEFIPGEYELRIAYSPSANRSTKTKVRILSANGEDVLLVNQRMPPSIDGLWHSLGRFTFELGGKASVTISNEGADGHVVIDAVQFLDVKTATAGVTALSLTDQELGEIKAEISQLESMSKEASSLLAQRPMTMGLFPLPSPQDIPIHIRGSVHTLGNVVPRGFLRCVQVSDAPAIPGNSNGRLELAAWISSPNNPLTARVYVNRVWYWLLGEGLVPSVDNFGTTGESTEHRKLLDWLTTQFMEHDWSTKWLVREILLSDAYRRQVLELPEQREIDPDNKLFARRKMKRLSGESIRDSLLGLSGRLDQSAVNSMNSSNKVKEDYGFQHSDRYRTVYGPWFRNALPVLFTEFDGPNPSYSSGERYVSTVAPQALAILNSPFTQESAKRIAGQIHALSSRSKEGAMTREDQIQVLFHWIVSRSASPAELDWAAGLVSNNQPDDWEKLALFLIASIDFRYLD